VFSTSHRSESVNLGAYRECNVHEKHSRDRGQVGASSLEPPNDKCCHCPADKLPACHAQVDNVLLARIRDSDLDENFLEIERQRVVAGPLCKHANTHSQYVQHASDWPQT
jgi:hypothetical protein